jgi:hypothetical protein
MSSILRRAFSKIDQIQNIILINISDHLSRIRIAVNVRMQFGVFIPKMSPNGCGFESPSGQITIFPIIYTRNVKLSLKVVKSTATVVER